MGYDYSVYPEESHWAKISDETPYKVVKGLQYLNVDGEGKILADDISHHHIDELIEEFRKLAPYITEEGNYVFIGEDCGDAFEIIIRKDQVEKRQLEIKLQRSKPTLVTFRDPSDKEIFDAFLIETNLSEENLQKIAEEIAREFEDQGHEDWSYDEIVDELEKRGLIKTLSYNTYEIYL